MLNKRLRTLRKNENMTQEELAKKIEVGRTTYAMYEQGQREPDFKTLKNIAEIFDVTIDYLVTGEKKQGNKEQLHFFDLEGLTEEQIEDIKEHIEYVKWKHQKHK